MNVLVAIDGSKYGRWELNWVAKLPLVEPPRVTVLHVLDSATLRAPFLAQPGWPAMSGTSRKKFSAWKHARERPSKRLSSSWCC